MTEVDQETAEFKSLMDYMRSTAGASAPRVAQPGDIPEQLGQKRRNAFTGQRSHDVVTAIYKISREGEAERFKDALLKYFFHLIHFSSSFIFGYLRKIDFLDSLLLHCVLPRIWAIGACFGMALVLPTLSAFCLKVCVLHHLKLQFLAICLEKASILQMSILSLALIVRVAIWRQHTCYFVMYLWEILIQLIKLIIWRHHKLEPIPLGVLAEVTPVGKRLPMNPEELKCRDQ